MVLARRESALLGEYLVLIEIIVGRERELLQVIGALRAPGRFASRLDRGK